MDSTEGYPVFIGDLPQDITEDELRTVFKTYGDVKRIKVLTDADRKPTGNAVVFYGFKKGAEDAITVLHKAYKIREGATRPIRVSWAVRGKANNLQDGPRNERAPSPEPTARLERPARRSPPRTARLERRPEPQHRSRSRGRADSRARAREGRPRQVLRARESRTRSAERFGRRPDDDRGEGGKDKGGKGWRRGDDEWEDWKQTGWRGDWGGGGWGKGKGKGKGKREADEDGPPPRWSKGDKGRGKAWWQGGNGAAARGGNKRLHVERLPKGISEGALKKGFGEFGELTGVKILPSRGGTTAAILLFASAEGAEGALSAVQSGYEFRPGDGPLSAKFAKPNPQWD